LALAQAFNRKGGFASCNDISRLSKPLQSRFRKLFLLSYTRDQFLDIAVKVCPKLQEEMARMVGMQVWENSKDVRDVISVAKLIKRGDTEEIEQIMRTLAKYGKMETEGPK
jgi:hypothetical protein